MTCHLQLFSGERGIRTPGGVTLNGFQDRRNRPLCHLSIVSSSLSLLKVSLNLRVVELFPFDVCKGRGFF